MIKAVFWDNDGVLVDTERLYFRATREIMAGVGFDLTEELFTEYFLTQSRGAWHFLENLGFSPEKIANLRLARNELYAGLLGDGNLAIAGVVDTLSRLHGRVSMGVVTSSRREHFDLIHRSTDLLQYLDFVLAREDYTNSKPDPEPYLRAVEESGCRPGECLVVEDSRRGFLAAKAAGLSCWVIPTELSRGSDFSDADRVLERIGEVADLLLASGEG